MQSKLVAAAVLLAACSESDDPSAGAEIVPYAVTPLALPTLDLVGTSAPGDVWTFTKLAGERYRLTGDRGTPSDPADDLVREGTLGSLQTIPGYAGQDVDGIFVFRPDGVGPNDGAVIVRLAGLGYVFALGDGAQDPVNVVAVDRGPCQLSAASYRPFELAMNTRPDGFRYPSVATFAPPDLTLAATADRTQDWLLGGARCDASGDVRWSTISTPYSREVNPQYPVMAPPVADIVGRLSPSGAFLIDYGKGFGGSILVPEATTLPRSQSDVEALRPLYRNRLFSGYLTVTSVFQPAGATRSDPSVPRTSRTAAFWTSLRTTEDDRSAVSFTSLSGDAVAPGTTASVDLTPIAPATAPAANSGGAVILFNAHDGGLNDLTLAGPVLRASGSRTISLVLSGANPAPLSPPSRLLAAISPPVPAGSELVQSLYVAYLTLVPPRSCEASTLPWPVDVQPARLAALDRPTQPQRVRIKPAPEAIDVSVITGTGAQAVRSSTPINGIQVSEGQALSIDPPAPAHAWRIFCGPDFLWPPGARQDAQSGRGYASDEGGFALAQGTYVLEHGPEVEPGGPPSPLSKHFVVRVCPAGGCAP